MVDLVLLGATAGPLAWGMAKLVDRPPLLGGASGLDAALRVLELDTRAVLGAVAPFWVMASLYMFLFWSLSGQTPGQKVLRMRVVDWRGETPRPLWSLVRVLAHALGLAAGALGWLWVAFDLERRAWHDHLARTYVVKET